MVRRSQRKRNPPRKNMEENNTEESTPSEGECEPARKRSQRLIAGARLPQLERFDEIVLLDSDDENNSGSDLSPPDITQRPITVEQNVPVKEAHSDRPDPDYSQAMKTGRLMQNEMRGQNLELQSGLVEENVANERPEHSCHHQFPRRAGCSQPRASPDITFPQPRGLSSNLNEVNLESLDLEVPYSGPTVHGRSGLTNTNARNHLEDDASWADFQERVAQLNEALVEFQEMLRQQSELATKMEQYNKDLQQQYKELRAAKDNQEKMFRKRLENLGKERDLFKQEAEKVKLELRRRDNTLAAMRNLLNG